MLTADLLTYSRRQGRIVPRLLDPADAASRAAAADLMALARAQLGRRRGELDTALRGFAPEAMTPKAAQGLVRLMLERCRFETGGGADPPALRAQVFQAGAEAWREGNWRGGPERQREILRAAGAGQGWSAERTEEALFADLAENQCLAGVDAVTAEDLLFRFNTAQVQGLLLQSEWLRIEAAWPSPQRLRQLFRYLKFFGLLYSHSPGGAGGSGASGTPGNVLSLTVDGPLAVLEGGASHGRNLANFFPALLLWPEDWVMRAEVRPARARGRSGSGSTYQLEMRPHPALRSHYPDHGQWVSEEATRFVEAFNRRAKGRWRAEAADALLPLAENRVLVPDFQFRPAAGGGDGIIVYLELLPYPDPGRAALRLEQAAEGGHGAYLVACRGTPAVRARLGGAPGLIAFRRGLIPGPVLEVLEERFGGTMR